jgi:hypothetical protein
MRELLLSVHYDYWILPALLILPLLGAALVMVSGRASAADEDEVASGAASGPRRLATIVFALEFLLSLGLWWAFDPSYAGWPTPSRGSSPAFTGC